MSEKTEPKLVGEVRVMLFERDGRIEMQVGVKGPDDPFTVAGVLEAAKLKVLSAPPQKQATSIQVAPASFLGHH